MELAQRKRWHEELVARNLGNVEEKKDSNNSNSNSNSNSQVLNKNDRDNGKQKDKGKSKEKGNINNDEKNKDKDKDQDKQQDDINNIVVNQDQDDIKGDDVNIGVYHGVGQVVDDGRRRYDGRIEGPSGAVNALTARWMAGDITDEKYGDLLDKLKGAQGVGGQAMANQSPPPKKKRKKNSSNSNNGGGRMVCSILFLF